MDIDNINDKWIGTTGRGDVTSVQYLSHIISKLESNLLSLETRLDFSEKTKLSHENKIEHFEVKFEDLRNVQEKQRISYEEQIKELRISYEDQIKELRISHEEQIKELRFSYENQIEIQKIEWKDSYEALLLKSKSENNEIIQSLNYKLQSLNIELRSSMGLRESSEKGRSITGSNRADGSNETLFDGSSGNGGNQNDGNCRYREEKNNKEKYEKLLISAKDEKNEHKKYLIEQGADKFDSKQDYLRAIGSDLALIPAGEALMHTCITDKKELIEKNTFDRNERIDIFGKANGFQSSTDLTTRYDFSLSLTKISCHNENLYDPITRKNARKSNDLGPKNYQLTWRALSNICLMIAEYAIPMERIGKMLGNPYFSSANISRWFQEMAEIYLPIYLYFAKQLSICNTLRTDDTNVLVLEMKKHAKSNNFKADAEFEGDDFEIFLDNLEEHCNKKRISNLIAPVARVLGRISQYASNEGGKKGVFLTLISGRPVNDSRSTIFFYRTHFGQAGNLLSRILESRSSKSTMEVIVQSDCANANKLEADISKFIKILESGCYSHARRPFAKYVDQDEELCYYLLRAFALIAANEDRAFRGHSAVTRELILYHRRFEKIIWKIIKNVCESVVAEKKHKYAKNKIWKSDSKLYAACKYIITHYKKLTLYLSFPDLFAENNCIERNLRPDKMIQDAAKFRASESGRVALDIIRTIIACCRSAEINFEDFTKFIRNAKPEDILANPEKYTPFAYGEEQRKLASRAPPVDSEIYDIKLGATNPM